MNNCKNCPCPEVCLKWEIFCKMAAREPQVKNELKAICERSIIGESPKSDNDRVSVKTALSLPGGGVLALPMSESISITKKIKECPHHKNGVSCGCSRCDIGKFGRPDPANGGTSCSFFDCWYCLTGDERAKPYAIKSGNFT